MPPRARVLLMGLISWLFGCGSDGPYVRKDGDWYFRKEKIALEAGETLTPLNAKFARSNRTAYFESASLGDVDVGSFEPLSDHYARDKHTVWYCDTQRDGREYFAVRRQRITPIAGADAPSFRMLGNDYARDTNFVYSDGQAFSVRDISTYERVGDTHARDRISGYFLRAEIAGSDGSTFSEVTNRYSRDAKHVYFSDFAANGGQAGPIERSVTLPDADPPTFAPLEHFYAMDRGQAYYMDRVLTQSVATFRVLDYGYAVTAHEVWYDGAVLPDADAATFQTLPAGDDSASAQDKRGKFQFAKRIK